jgi:nicotinate-nucleotide adenylyltransferase
MRLGVFGGTFDPPHTAHLVAAQELHTQLGLDRLLWMVAAVPPHKVDRDVTPGDARLEMVRAAIADDPRFEASGLELEREGPSYTVDTLRTLRARYPDAELFLAIGADQAAELDSWKDPDEIARLATIVAFARSGQRVADSDYPLRRLDVPRMDLSSTEVRRRVGAGEPYRYLVPDAVAVLIETRGLYR